MTRIRISSALILSSTLLTLVHSMERSAIYMKKSQIADQAASASGFAYQVQSGGPLSYTSFSSDVGGVSGLNNFGYPPVTLGRYPDQELPVELALPVKYIQEGPGNVPINSYGVPASVAAYTLPLLRKGVEGIGLPIAKYGAPAVIGRELAEDAQFSKGAGSSYGAGDTASQGEQGARGYKNHHEYDKGSQGKHEKEAHKGYYNKEGGNKAGHHEIGTHYDKKQQAAKGAKGASFRQSSGNKKGSKTTGYHNVYHKDEYKKDHSFYDESDNRGHFNKYGDFDAKQAAEKGAFVKGGHHDSGFKGDQYGAKGFLDKGRFIDNASGYKGAQGKDSYYKDFSEYAKKAGEEQAQENGYNKKGDASSYDGYN